MPTEKEFVHWLLGVPTIGLLRTRKLLAHFGTAAAVWEAAPADLHFSPTFSQTQVDHIVSSKVNYSFESEAAKLKQAGIRILHQTDERFPSPLHELYDPPTILYVYGEWIHKDEKAIAVVGARQATNYGKIIANKLSEELAAAGVTIISGMARGIDTIAHEAALRAHGRTVAVMAGGLSHLYPAHNRQLAKNIIKNGAIFSEFHPNTPPHPGMFPIRNRIISGLSRAVLVIEAARKSGSLITADQALEQNREIFAVPGPITSPLSQGTNDLIRQGAKLVTGVEDIWEEYPSWKPASLSGVPRVPLDRDEKSLLDTIGYGGVHVDQLSKASGLALSDLHRILLGLELKGIIKQMPGQLYMRTTV